MNIFWFMHSSLFKNAATPTYSWFPSAVLSLGEESAWQLVGYWSRDFQDSGTQLFQVINSTPFLSLCCRGTIYFWMWFRLLYPYSCVRFLCRDKKKEIASNCAAYYPFGLDVFLSQRKIDHIAQFVDLPVIASSGKLPPILVLNVQVPNTRSRPERC